MMTPILRPGTNQGKETGLNTEHDHHHSRHPGAYGMPPE
jgi:hypothetical protein